ncbi:MAG: hypothetical protein L0219_19985 [Phycisphaerales bacterium]|nr:hypothetical protein [Phycisphaerales bacterium]
MTPQQNELWSRIEAFKIEDGKPRFGFLDRLTRENNWSLEFARSALAEYKRFVFLAVAAGHPVTPSEVVDSVWHLHLKYTRSYWERLCQDVLQQPLHHDPASGAADEDGKFADQYRRTLESYERMCGAPPPAAVWPRAIKHPGVQNRAAVPAVAAIHANAMHRQRDPQTIGNFRRSNNRPVIILIVALVTMLLIALIVGWMIRGTAMFGLLIALGAGVVAALVGAWARLARQMREPYRPATSDGGAGMFPVVFACGGGGGSPGRSQGASPHDGAATQPDSGASPHSGIDAGSAGDTSGGSGGGGASSCGGGAASCGGGGASCGGGGCGGGGCGGGGI